MNGSLDTDLEAVTLSLVSAFFANRTVSDPEIGGLPRALNKANSNIRVDTHSGGSSAGANLLGVVIANGEETGQSVHMATLAVCNVLIGIVVLMGCVGNGAVIVQVITNWRTRFGFGPLILNLAVSDFLICSCLSPVFLIFLFRSPPTPNIFCGLFTFLGTTCTLSSLLTMVSIALHRYRLVSGTTGRRHLSIPLSLLTLAFIWSVGLGVALAGILYVSGSWSDPFRECELMGVTRTDHGLFDFAISFLAPVCAVSFICTAASCVIMVWIARFPSCWKLTCEYYQTTSSGEKEKPWIALSVAFKQLAGCFSIVDKETRILYLVAILIAAFCWSPILIAQILSVSTGESLVLYQLKLCGIALVFLNSALHPYIYTEHGWRLKHRYRVYLHAAFDCRRTTTEQWPVECAGNTNTTDSSSGPGNTGSGPDAGTDTEACDCNKNVICNNNNNDIESENNNNDSNNYNNTISEGNCIGDDDDSENIDEGIDDSSIDRDIDLLDNVTDSVLSVMLPPIPTIRCSKVIEGNQCVQLPPPTPPLPTPSHQQQRRCHYYHHHHHHNQMIFCSSETGEDYYPPPPPERTAVSSDVLRGGEGCSSLSQNCPTCPVPSTCTFTCASFVDYEECPVQTPLISPPLPTPPPHCCDDNNCSNISEESPDGLVDVHETESHYNHNQHHYHHHHHHLHHHHPHYQKHYQKQQQQRQQYRLITNAISLEMDSTVQTQDTTGVSLLTSPVCPVFGPTTNNSSSSINDTSTLMDSKMVSTTITADQETILSKTEACLLLQNGGETITTESVQRTFTLLQSPVLGV